MKVLTNKLGFGTWQFGGENIINGQHKGWGDIEEAEAIQAVHLALDSGVKFFDTADTYGEGQAEKILGKAIEHYPKDRLTICTKFGCRKDNQGRSYQDFSSLWLEQAVANSLKRLKIDCIDILLFHSPPDDFDWSRYDVSTLQGLIQKGYIKQYGVSSKTIKGALKVIEKSFGTVIEAIFNVLDRRAEQYLINKLSSRYKFVARVPLASGFIRQKYLHQDPDFANNDWRKYLPDRDRQWLLDNVRKLSFLDQLPGGITVSALRYILHHPQVGVVIPGMRNSSQLAANLEAVYLGKIDAEIVKKIQNTVPNVPVHWRF
ncbi:aldo/keto reductase [Moorena sp. SIO4A5]|uniref:aldo/keto reductase n=1 Tax=Moorena sp. SIO4A5 TaxID=2607838 RepID=UPI0013C71714|nr:aldo/keto reductase [Moorena sp. SIO4A5]NEO21425.1 aldo/keto reductase [Moorena sp. SIO4A5]